MLACDRVLHCSSVLQPKLGGGCHQMSADGSSARYRDVRKLGHGNFGAAWLVQDLQQDREWFVPCTFFFFARVPAGSNAHSNAHSVVFALLFCLFVWLVGWFYISCTHCRKVLKRIFVGTLKETDSEGALREAKLLSQVRPMTLPHTHTHTLSHTRFHTH